jgi:cobalamin biosynthetic protein CobC
LQDQGWQLAERQRLARESSRLAGLLARHGLSPAGGTALFQWMETEKAPAIQDALARQGIWVRRFDAPPSLRFGLPGIEAEWQRLDAALKRAGF